jgi:hypothetical protein
MRIEVLYVSGCPNYEPAVERIRKVLASESVEVGIRAVSVNTEAEAKAPVVPRLPDRSYQRRGCRTNFGDRSQFGLSPV